MKKITNEEYQRACTEAYEIITKYLEDDIASKIPREKIEYYKNNKDNNYVFDYHEELSLEEQITYATKCILANLFKDYIANEEDKQQIILQERKQLQAIEEEKMRKYNPDDIFKNRAQKNVSETNNENNGGESISEDKSMVTYNEDSNILKKILNFFKKFIKKN